MPTEEKIKIHPTHASSIPAGDLKERTKGKQPRSREASSRDMFLRETEDLVNHYKQMFQREAGSVLDIPADQIPEGVVTLWARKYLKGMPDSHNLATLEQKGWKYATPAHFPSLAFSEDGGEIDDSTGRINNHEYCLMYREKFINDLEAAKIKKEIDLKNSPQQNIASTSHFGKDSHAYGGIMATQDSLSSGFNDVYASSNLGRSVFQDHLK